MGKGHPNVWHAAPAVSFLVDGKAAPAEKRLTTRLEFPKRECLRQKTKGKFKTLDLGPGKVWIAVGAEGGDCRLASADFSIRR